MAKIQDNYYRFDYNDKKYVMQRYYGLLPNGEPSTGMWAIFEIKTGKMLDWGQYQNDLISRYKIPTSKGFLG